ncbi:MAG: hypothetical protein LBR22_02020 [Desulfovibrio sp.]|nr:hypothetical protein [Desulfovibrio sp.]
MTIQEILEEDRKVSFYSEGFEIGFKQGIEDVRQWSLMRLQKHALSQLKMKFNRVPKALANQIKAINDFNMLTTILGLFGGAESLEDAERHVNAVLATA